MKKSPQLFAGKQTLFDIWDDPMNPKSLWLPKYEKIIWALYNGLEEPITDEFETMNSQPFEHHYNELKVDH